MQRIKKHSGLYIIVAVLIAAMLVSLYYQFGYLPQTQSGASSNQIGSPVVIQSVPAPQETGGSNMSSNITSSTPSIFAMLSFSNETGFKTTVYPNSETVEFVLLPNSTGEFAVTYTGYSNLTVLFFTHPASVLNVLPNGTLGTGTGLSVTESSPTLVNPNQVVVNYTVTSGASNGLYVLDLPSTFLSTIVNVGTQPYTGPLTWLNGTFN